MLYDRGNFPATNSHVKFLLYLKGNWINRLIFKDLRYTHPNILYKLVMKEQGVATSLVGTPSR